MGIFTTIFILFILGYIGLGLYQLYLICNPLVGYPIDVNEQIVDPHWKLSQEFDIICFLSLQSKFKPFRLSDLLNGDKVDESLLLHQKNLQYNQSQVELNFDLKISTNNNNNNINDNNDIAISSNMWNIIHSNSTLRSIYLHVLIRKSQISKEDNITAVLFREGSALYGIVNMVKFDKIPLSFKHRYLLSDFGLVNISDSDMKKLRMPSNSKISYWKPEVAVRLVTDFTVYPTSNVPTAIQNLTFITSNAINSHNKRGFVYKPPVHVDEIGLTSDKYIPLNDTVSSLPIKVSYAPMSLQRWLLMQTMEESISSQSGLGFSDKDTDDVRRLISDTSIYLLSITTIAALLHLFFEFLAMQSDIMFWNQNKSLAGLSSRSIVSDLFSQIIVFLFLVDSNTSLLITIPSFISILIQIWKVRRATGFTLRFKNGIISYEFCRWKTTDDNQKDEKEIDGKGKEEKEENENKEEILTKRGRKKADKSPPLRINEATPEAKEVTPATEVTPEMLEKVTLEADAIATKYIGTFFVPVVIGFVIRSLVYDKHKSWYSFSISSLCGFVYTFGFILMCPQLFINHKLKSVSHLPWNFLIYKFLNTFIDDLFAFIIRMPTMHRMAVFRDDIVFLVYLYQRWIYRIDLSRPIEK